MLDVPASGVGAWVPSVVRPCAGCHQTAAPTSAPMPAVTAMASAPQPTPLIVARRGFAPPRLAPRAPRPANARIVTATQTATRADAETAATARTGSTAPAEKDT